MDQNQESGSVNWKLIEDFKNNIVAMNQKLRGIRAEIQAKQQSLAFYKGADKEELIERFGDIDIEIGKMIESIKVYINIMSSDNEALKEIFFQTEDLRPLNDLFIENLQKISKIRERL